MIQRIQTVFLLVGLVLVNLSWAFPLATYINGDVSLIAAPYGVQVVGDYAGEMPALAAPVMGSLVGIASLIILVVIFSFKNRPRQIRFGNIAVVALLISGVYGFLWTILMGNIVEVQFGMASIFPIVAIIPVLLAVRAVKKDEALVRSADRLR